VQKIFFLLVFFLVNHTASAYQDNALDSILTLGSELEQKKEFDTALDLYEKALLDSLSIAGYKEIIVRMASINYRIKQYKIAKSLYNKVIQQNTTDSLLVKSYIGLSFIYRKLKSRDSSIYFIEKAALVNKKIPESYFKANSNHKIGFIYKNYDLNDRALLVLLEAYNGYKTHNDLINLANVCNSIGYIHRLEGNVSTSLIYYHKAKSLSRDLNDSEGLSIAYNNLGNGHKSLIQLDSAIYYYKESLITKLENNLKNRGFTLHNLGTTYYMKGDGKNAKKYYLRALKVKKEENDTKTQIYTYNELAMIAIEENLLDLASEYLDSSQVYTTEINDASLRWYELKKTFYQRRGNYEDAFKYLGLYTELYKKLYSTEKSKIIIGNQERFDTNKRIEKIENLTEVNEKTTQTLNTRTLYLIATASLLVLVVIIYYLSYQRQKLAAQKEEIKNLIELFMSQDMVRNKIGRDLHDIVKSKYEGIRLMIASLSLSSQINNDIHEINKEISDANEQVRTLSHRLSPLDQRILHSSLNQIIRAELNKLQLYTPVQVIITSELPEIWNEMKLASQNHLYGILLECINNIRDHSNATEVIISSSSAHNMSTFTITDNGTQKTMYREGVGIGNMKSRARLLHGKLEIYVGNESFQVALEFPINKNMVQ
jgi:signal transduction histidine kinase